MAANIEQLVGRVQALDQRLTDTNDLDSAPTSLLQEYRAACENVIFSDFEYATANGIEAQLWNAHIKVNNIFRKQFRQLRRKAKDNVVELRKLAKDYLAFIKGSQRFYRTYILNLDAQSEGIAELRKIAQEWKDDGRSQASPRRPIPAKLKSLVLQSCHQALIQLGDLSRYRETELVEKNRNWGPAKGYYNLAAEIFPSSGQSHNQLAVIAREDGDHFRSTYHLYRSLGSKQPHPLAKQNLELEFRKIVSAWSKGELINNHKSSDGNTAGRALIAWFIRLHSKCYKGQEFAQHDELENEVLSHLAIELKERSLDSVLHKIILINLAAEYFSTLQMQYKIMRTYFYYLRLNVKTFFTLLQILQSELERLSEGDDVTQNGDHPSQLSDKITAVARRVLPGLRLYSTWFSRYWNVLHAKVADTLTEVEVQELWKAYAASLTLLASSFPVAQLPSDNYMLEEDTDTVGFQPLTSPETMKLWYNGSSLKQKWTDLGRNHPNIEMLMRIRDLLVDGLRLTQIAEAPLDLVGLRFIYHETGLPSELLASPKSHTEGSPIVSTEPMDLPLFPQDTPIAEDQKSYSVAAPSESASTVLAKDTAMNRMVDELVGPDDGLDPLPEEDENIPPTPPEQTFEDTVVTENAHGLSSFTINDIVSTVQNYQKPTASPVPAQQLCATPMNRVASSSSIRQPVNLPSIPDGQFNSGNSIWNRNYSCTPGPSSPLLNNSENLRGSPSSNVRLDASYGHSRGDSSNSLHSNDWSYSSMQVQRPASGRVIGGAAWGNPALSTYGSIYGNNYNYSNGSNSTDYNLASPLLFGKGTWNTELESAQSSYGRTPPNGQAG